MMGVEFSGVLGLAIVSLMAIGFDLVFHYFLGPDLRAACGRLRSVVSEDGSEAEVKKTRVIVQNFERRELLGTIELTIQADRPGAIRRLEAMAGPAAHSSHHAMTCTTSEDRAQVVVEARLIRELKTWAFDVEVEPTVAEVSVSLRVAAPHPITRFLTDRLPRLGLFLGVDHPDRDRAPTSLGKGRVVRAGTSTVYYQRFDQPSIPAIVGALGVATGLLTFYGPGLLPVGWFPIELVQLDPGQTPLLLDLRLGAVVTALLAIFFFFLMHRQRPLAVAQGYQKKRRLYPRDPE